MRETRYVALLRGINVGGSNVIPMAALRAAFEARGFTRVTTYIASGNVLFTGTATSKAKLTAAIEAHLGETFGYASRVVLLSAAELARAVDEAPPGFGRDPKRFRYDVIFVKPPLTARAALRDVPTKEGVDEVHAGAHALYFSRLIAKASQSRLVRIVQMPIYANVTVRNWNTTRKLLELAGKSEAGASGAGTDTQKLYVDGSAPSQFAHTNHESFTKLRSPHAGHRRKVASNVKRPG
jgi:uncharacterized protein (DUF1697 family)